MMTANTIDAIVEEQTRRAKREGRRPYLITSEEDREKLRGIARDGGKGIPFLGGYVPKDWVRTKRALLFCDSSGFGQPGEPALTIAEFIDALQVGYGYATVEAGQFQVCVAEYRPKRECEALYTRPRKEKQG